MYRLFLSLRYFRTRFLALAAFLAITFGVAMLLIVLGVMGGYIAQLRENIRGQESHLQVLGPGQLGVTGLLDLEEAIEAVDNVAGVAPFIERRCLLFSGISVEPARIHGIDPVRQARVSDFGRYVLRPAELEAILDAHVPPPPQDETDETEKVDVPRAIRAVHALIHAPGRAPLSDEEIARFFALDFRAAMLARYRPRRARDFPVAPPAVLVGVHLLLEGRVTLGQPLTVSTLSPDDGRLTKATFLVVGALRTGDFSEDSSTLYVDVESIRGILSQSLPHGVDPFRYQGIRVAIEDLSQLEETRKAVADAVVAIDPLLQVKTWLELRQNMLKAVGREMWIVYFIVLILVFFTGSMILLMLLLTVIEKTRDIGILMALGATPNGVTAIFLINGLLISILGTLAGLGAGYLFCDNINEIHDRIYALTGRQLFAPEIYQMDRIPVAFEAANIAWSTVPPIAVGLLASLVPAAWAPRRDPIRSIQRE
jgi:lipoprotein-releasing system permease protein